MLNSFDYSINDMGKSITTKYDGKMLILLNVYLYDGPITLQYLPSGGIQTIYNNELVIRVKDGFIACKSVIYDCNYYSINAFVKLYPNLINQILPN